MTREPRKRFELDLVDETLANIRMKNPKKRAKPDRVVCLLGEPISDFEARMKHSFRYESNKTKTIENPEYAAKTRKNRRKNNTEEKVILQAKFHYKQARVDGTLYNLGDDVFIKREEGEVDYIGKILEFFRAIDGRAYFRACRFYRPEDTVIKTVTDQLHEKIVFLSDDEIDRPLNFIISAAKIIKLPSEIGLRTKERLIPECDYFYVMKYELAHLSFKSGDDDTEASSSTVTSDCSSNLTENPPKNEKFLLDLFSGCGAMSTGLTMGASKAGLNLITKWAVDKEDFACQSFKHNHPQTEVRCEEAEDFLALLKVWKKLCQRFSLVPGLEPIESDDDMKEEAEEEDSDENDAEDQSDIPPGEFEVGEFLDIRVVDTALQLKVRWEGYGADEDTWEPYASFGKCTEKLKEFVSKGFKSNYLPLPGSVYFVCGGPPCQGVSGFNRNRNTVAPLKDDKNHQIDVYMNIVDFLKPNYVLMENVVDLFKFEKGLLGRHACASLVAMNYQARLGLMAAGSYGVPQVRNRVFLWGALPTEKLPPYPLPTHNVLGKISPPIEFQKIQVGRFQKPIRELRKALTLGDAIEDLPTAINGEEIDVTDYNVSPKTEFQKFIRLARGGGGATQLQTLYDHQPYKLNDDDMERTELIPKRKGACFRDLPGLIVIGNKVSLDPSVERRLCKSGSGKPQVPDYTLSFVKGKSKKPFGRLWFDEIVRTIVTRAEPHNQCVLHPYEDRVLSVRENARCQGFPDWYKLSGPTCEEKYVQVGNAVAIPVGIALGYAFGIASQGLGDDKPVIELPFYYPECLKMNPEDQVE